MKRLIKLVKSNIGRIAIALIFFISALIIEQTINKHVALALYIVALIIAGCSVFVDAVRGIIRRDFLDEKFLMTIASIGAMVVGEWREGVAVMLFASPVHLSVALCTSVPTRHAFSPKRERK